MHFQAEGRYDIYFVLPSLFIDFSFLDLSKNITTVTESQHSLDYGSTYFVLICYPTANALLFFSTDEIQKASAYMTETYYLSSSKQTRDGREPTRAPFCFAFDTVKTGTGFFGWLEGEIETTADGDGVDDGYAPFRRVPAFRSDFLCSIASKLVRGPSFRLL